MTPTPLDLAAVRARLAGRRGHDLWRSLEELAETPAFVELVHRELPQQAALLDRGLDRRQFLKLMAASLGLAGLAACASPPQDEIVPYVSQPEGLVLGEPRFYATAVPQGGFAIGVLAASFEGRPTKLEGNPQHPASLGAIDPPTQAALLDVYDPERSQTITNAGQIQTWQGFLVAIRGALDTERPRRGAGLRVLTETITSPTLDAQLRALLAEFPEATWHQWDPVGRDPARAGAQRAFGTVVETRYDLSRADVVLTLDADLFTVGPSRLRYAREIGARRRPGSGMNRLYAVESMPTTIGAIADHRLPLAAGDVEAFARALAAELGCPLAAPPPAELARAHRPWLRALAADLRAHQGACAVVPGEHQPPAVHALAHAINAALGNFGHTVIHTDAVEASPIDQVESLQDLVTAMRAGSVSILVILGGNPVYTAPADLDFQGALARVPLRVHLSLYQDETSALCHWHVNAAHVLETWSDARAHDGTVTILQPLIAPLYGGRSAHEVLAALTGPERSSHDLVREHWQGVVGGADFEAFWRRALHDGVVPGTALAPRAVALRPDWDVPTPATGPAALEVVFRPDPYLGDGAAANNGWLQELPRPITKLTWDNAALLAPATAERLGLRNGDVVELAAGSRRAEAPVWIVPGHARDAVTVHLGYGRRRSGALGTGVGFDAYALRTAAALHVARGATVRPTGRRHAFACTQTHHAMEGRALVRSATLAEWQTHPDFARALGEEPPREATLYPPHAYDGYAWGMAIDLAACIGCNACVLACQAENNVAVVGKAEVARGHEMHWLRVDRYFAGDPDAPAILHQPVPCMHCENAPCEVVCPVNATNHDGEGLNVMVYNRCVGTRYCSNNCPYKVRRFNFFLYSDWATETLKMARNPEVTVRSRGVMEKCTYCVQRIARARIRAEEAGRTIADGELVTACQQACPTEAIVFGNVNDPESRVARLKADARNYALLGELNTRPRTTYLAAVRNPNPMLAGETPS